MFKIIFALICSVLLALSLTTIVSIKKSSAVRANATSSVEQVQPAISPDALMRVAPRNLPTENWNPI